MGKSKKRIFNKYLNNINTTLKRKDIVKTIISDIKVNLIKDETKNLISLFGISTEELLEAGATYEEISVIKSFLNK